jgi:hypothetical protein
MRLVKLQELIWMQLVFVWVGFDTRRMRKRGAVARGVEFDQSREICNLLSRRAKPPPFALAMQYTMDDLGDGAVETQK